MSFHVLVAAACDRKRSFATEEDASKSAKDRGYSNPQMYRCEFCQGFHLTRIVQRKGNHMIKHHGKPTRPKPPSKPKPEPPL